MPKLFWDERANKYEDIGYHMRDRDGSDLVTIKRIENKDKSSLEGELRLAIIDNTMHISRYEKDMKNLIVNIDELIPALLQIFDKHNSAPANNSLFAHTTIPVFTIKGKDYIDFDWFAKKFKKGNK